ncbi:GNAT family N-acetyltransferase [Phaeobacter sp. HF9A]|uniref:GNAT family N-acetyltransferase n=1 Tax=Phaeobacter sp. HF9A TaxID=2721561 RepID=UPI0014305035|nr:GNAT family N-acetyltransferase [Phaeobacter sp. HF9A]NIZ13189.1 GNAT family N-acetyltransferase [Phaeobacter sp. HF9A]
MAKSVRVKSFDLVAQDIDEIDVDLLHALSIGVGWPHRPADWDFLRRVGEGIVAVDGIGRVFGSAMWFPHGTDFATVGLVITTPRAQANGAGRWLMEQVLERCDGRNLSLNATKVAYPLYVSLDFQTEATVYMRQGSLCDSPDIGPVDGTLTALPADHIDAVFGFDARAFGTDRARQLALLAEISVSCVLMRDGDVAGYAMRHEFGRGHVIGPIVAQNDQDAIQLAAWHLRALKGGHARIDTRQAQGAFADFLNRCGLGTTETVITMSKGRPFLTPTADAPSVYGLAGHALS